LIHQKTQIKQNVVRQQEETTIADGTARNESNEQEQSEVAMTVLRQRRP
jgi:hypothetical protein